MNTVPLSDVPQMQGTDRTYDILLTSDGITPITTFTSAATISAQLWAGGAQPILATLGAAWIDPTAGTLALTVSATVSSGLAPGRYRVIVKILAGGVEYDALPGGVLDVEQGPTSDVQPATFITLQDMVDLADWISNIQGDHAAAGFLKQRSQATQWLKAQVIARAESLLDDQMRRHNPILAVDPLIPQTGFDAGPWWGPSTIPDTTRRDQLTQFQTYLDTPGVLMLDSPLDGGKGRKACAEYAIHLACRTQIGRKSETPYKALGDEFRSYALRSLLSWTARLDTNNDGVAEFELKG